MRSRPHRFLFVSVLQAGAKGRADSPVSDVPACPSASLDCCGRLSSQDSAGD